MPPDVSYARNADTHIAYTVFGEGAINLVISPGFVSHVELLWTEPSASQWLERFGSFARVALYDKPGTGASDPVLHSPTLEERVDDLGAVADAAGFERFSIYGYSEGGPTACTYAGTHPQRVDKIVLWGSFAAGPRTSGPRPGLTPELFDEVTRWAEHASDDWGRGHSVRRFIPSLADVPGITDAWAVLERRAASPAMVRHLMVSAMYMDVRPILTTLSSPVLVQHREGDQAVSVALGRELAAHIPHARLSLYPGIDHVPWVDHGAAMEEVEGFLTGASPRRTGERALATVLFTDIVDSTRRAAEFGDREWRRLMDVHDRVTLSAVEAEAGRVIKSLGDGAMSEFAGPASAIRAADSIRRRLHETGLGVRAGVHTGECERVGDDLIGIAVNIAARVARVAAPGEILVSATVPGLVVGSGIVFEDRGEHELKGVPDAWRLHAVTRI